MMRYYGICCGYIVVCGVNHQRFICIDPLNIIMSPLALSPAALSLRHPLHQ